MHTAVSRSSRALRGGPALRTKVSGPLYPGRTNRALSRPPARSSHWQERYNGPAASRPACPAARPRRHQLRAQHRWAGEAGDLGELPSGVGGSGTPRRAVAFSPLRGWGRGWRGLWPAPDRLPELAFALPGAWRGLSTASEQREPRRWPRGRGGELAP